eukprot:8782523-Ditylum_brightwellii.AAC.1
MAFDLTVRALTVMGLYIHPIQTMEAASSVKGVVVELFEVLKDVIIKDCHCCNNCNSSLMAMAMVMTATSISTTTSDG